MNAKRAKLLRATVRRLGRDLRDARYMIKPGAIQGHRIFTRVGENGEKVPTKFHVTKTIILAPACPRAMYQRMKAAA